MFLQGYKDRRCASFSSVSMEYGNGMTWDCTHPIFAKVKPNIDVYAKESANGKVVYERDQNLVRRKFYLETGGMPEFSNDHEGTFVTL